MRARTVQPGLTFEYIMWIFTRISGLAMILLALIGIAGAFYLGARTQMDMPADMPALLRWTFFPNPNHVVNSEIPDVTLGWATAFWQIMQILIIFFAATHAYNGLRVIIEDYTDRSFWRPLVRGFIFLLWLFSLVLAIYVILAS